MIEIVVGILVLGILFIGSRHKIEMAKVDASRDGVDYDRGFNDGLEKAAKLVSAGEESMKSNMYSPSGVEFAKLIRSAKVKDAP